MTKLTFSCSRSTPRSLHIFRKWENEDWSRRIYTLTCRWLQASKRSVKISVSVKESITRAIICNEFQKKPLSCFHSITREIAHEKFDFQIKYSPPPPFSQVVMKHGTVFCDTEYSSLSWDRTRPLVLPYVRQIWSLLSKRVWFFGFFLENRCLFLKSIARRKRWAYFQCYSFPVFQLFKYEKKH